LVDIEGIRDGRDGEIAAPDQVHDLSPGECIKRIAIVAKMGGQT
jgi:hypothetical protein